MVLLQTIDARWKDHLQIIDHLKEGINLRAYAQKDPLVEYKQEGFRAFETMNQVIASEVIEKILKVRLVSPEETEEALRERRERQRPQKLQYQGSEASEGMSALRASAEPQPQAGRAPAGLGQPRGQSAPPPGFPSRQQMQDDGPKMNREQRRRLEKKKNR